MTSPAQLHLLTTASRLALRHADRCREQTRLLVAASSAARCPVAR